MGERRYRRPVTGGRRRLRLLSGWGMHRPDTPRTIALDAVLIAAVLLLLLPLISGWKPALLFAAIFVPARLATNISRMKPRGEPHSVPQTRISSQQIRSVAARQRGEGKQNDGEP